MSTLDTASLQECRLRISSGDRLPTLAKRFGVTWQKLHALLYPAPATELPPPKLRHSIKLVDAYRPSTLADLKGQAHVSEPLRRFAASPHPTAMLFEGDTGTGKTSAALALAHDLGCDVEQEELGGVRSIASGEQTAENVRDLPRSLALRPMYGSGWKLAIINECDRMHAAAETIWLDRLEAIPAKCVIVFTTNHTAKLSQRFLDRCERFAFVSDSATLRPAAIELLRTIWQAEVDSPLRLDIIEDVVNKATESKQLSLRRCVQMFQQRLS